jgi:NADPH-dependent glutamate synthase beta subunit-like oxidoreductase
VYNDGKILVGPTGGADFASSECRFCGACAEVCPTGAIMDKDLPKGDREAALVPCKANCPAGLDIPGYIDLIHTCEDACRRGELNEPMAICALKRFVAENDGGEWKDLVKADEPTGKKVAIVGSGPAGLTAAWFLARKGHKVTVFEEEENIGGMLRYGIPDYRIPPDVLDAELEQFSSLGVEFRTGVRVGGDVTMAQLRDEHDAVFLGTGAFLSRKISVEGDDMEGVLWGLDLLKDVKRGKLTSMSGKGVVIGGGNVAIDVARTALRLGADGVELACLECSDEMPAHSWEIEEAKEEGVVMDPSWGPKRILGEGGKVTGIELKKCTSVFDQNQCFAPEFDEGETITKDADWLALAIGQASDLSYLDDGKMTFSGEGMTAGLEGVFAGGEAARGPSSVVDAVADGAAAAAAMDRHMGGDGEIYRPLRGRGAPDPDIGRIEGFAAMSRVDAGKAPAADRVKDFGMVENAYDEAGAKGEAARCLRCELRLDLPAVTLPPEKWMELTEENVAEVPALEGVYQLLDEEKLVIVIKGTQNMHSDLMEKVEGESKAAYFSFEPDPMYSKRESELIAQFLQAFGKMPEGDGGGDDMDDLF